MSISLSSHLLQNPQASPYATTLFPVPYACHHDLEASAILFVDVPVALLFHPVLQNHGHTKNQNEIDTNNTKGRGEDLIKVSVGE